jgi:two-component system sensor histidine kinase SenX3
VTRRQKAATFFVVLCVVLVAATLLLNVGWILSNTGRLTALIFGVVLFGCIIAGLIVYTVFLVLEIRRNEQHDSFISAVTHELKTPIASIRLYLETLKTRDVNEEQRRAFYDIMLADADRLQHTVEQVLKAGMARERSQTAQRASVDVRALAQECVSLAAVRHHLQAGAIDLQSHDDGPLVAQANADELRTVLANLLDNAVKYSGPIVRVTVSVASPSPQTIWVRVQDHGVGIPKKQLKRIFHRFYRAPARGAKTVKGTGLGLYIVRSIARAHGGRVFAQSEGEGRGATFTLELPRLAVEKAPLVESLS